MYVAYSTYLRFFKDIILWKLSLIAKSNFLLIIMVEGSATTSDEFFEIREVIGARQQH